jgi:O-antigen/teichoic acid export membrane protein
VSMLMDAGLTPTLTRRIAFAAGLGSAAPDRPLDESARHALAGLLSAGAVAYRALALVVFAVSFALGSLYLSQLPLRELPAMTVWSAWLLMCFGHAAMMWSGLWLAVGAGLGYVATGAMLAAAIGAATVIMQIVAVVAGGGLLWLALVSVASGLAYRIVLRAYVRRRQPDLCSLPGSWSVGELRGLVGPAIRSWLTALGTVSLFKTDQYFIALYIDPGEVPAYYATYTLLHNLTLLALALGQSASVFVSQMWHAGNIEKIHAIVLRSLRISLILMACGTAVLLVNGGDLISAWVGAGHFAGYRVLTILCVTFFLCTQQNGWLAFSRATENEVYAPAFVVAGALNLMLAWALVRPLQLTGVALATLLAQLLTTNWVVLLDGSRRLKLPLVVYCRSCVTPSIVVLAIAIVALLSATHSRSTPSSALGCSFLAIAIGGCVCGTSLWLFGLTADERSAFTGKLRGRVHSFCHYRHQRPRP